MSDFDEVGGCIGAALLVVLFVTAVTLAVMTLMTAGAVFGAGVAVRNYALAVRNNVRLERVTP